MAVTNAAELVAFAVRTLLASGFDISRSTRIPTHLEIEAQREDQFGAQQRYLFALTERDAYASDTRAAILRVAQRDGRAPVLVANAANSATLSFADFFQVLGGAVPAWRALSNTYESLLLIAGKNVVPDGMSGEAWLIFEELVADGLGFLFGRRVRRQGGLRRGKPVSDMLAVLPDMRLLVVDAKATGSAFEANRSNLRALGEYTRRQIQRQQGKNQVFGAVVVSSAFEQTDGKLTASSQGFLADYDRPLAFLTTDALATTVNSMREVPSLRNSVEWHRALAGGAAHPARFADEIQRAREESVTKD